MKFVCTVLLSSLLFATALAQSIQIGYPTSAESITKGKELIVEVDRPDSLTGSTEIALAIGLQSCSSASACAPFDPTAHGQHVLYLGPYNPQFSKPYTGAPNQKFRVHVPASISSGTALLSVAHLALVGAGESPFYEVVNVTIHIA